MNNFLSRNTDMFTPYQHEPIYGVSSIWATVDHAEPAPTVCFKIWALKEFTHHAQNGITTEDYGPGSDFEEVSKILPRSATSTPIERAPQIIRNPANAPLAVEPMSLYQRVLRREVETLFGTANHAQVPSVCSIIAV